ncbi:MAG: alpha/beta fold hydrolase, partial [Chloroflexi bacterium]|nr:alpha/beta fold hydrolase [Chloroflexota bacterium]
NMIWQALAYSGDAHVINVTAPERESRAAESRPAAAPAQPAATEYGRADMQTAYVAPGTAIEQALAEVWSAVLGIDPIGVHDNFFELRGDSLLALQLVARLHERFQVAVPMRSIFETPTVAELAETIDALRGPSAEHAPAVPASLVRLQPHGNKRPFFCIHPSGGIGACYAGLARLLDPDQPFYAVEALGVDGTQLPRTSIQDMARAYIQDIRTVQPEGPYLLGGWSMGGSIAFEMAQQLKAAGHEVDLLVLIDTQAKPTGAPPSEIDDVDLVATMLGAEMQLDRDLLLGHDTDTQLAILLEKAQAARILPQHFALEQFRRVIHTFRTHTQAWWDYRPGPYAGYLTVLKAEETIGDEDLAWREVTAADVEVHRIPGNHQTLILPPQLDALARQLDACLKAVQEPVGIGQDW